MKKVLIFCIACCVLLVTLFGGFYIHSQPAEAQHAVVPTIGHPLDAAQVLKKSQMAMAHLRSVRFDLDSLTQTYQTPGGVPTKVPAALSGVLQPLPGGVGGWEVKGSGVVTAPDQSRLDLHGKPVPAGSGGTSFHRIVNKDNVYLSGQYTPDDGWYRISKENLLASKNGADYLQVGMPQVSAMIDLSLRKGILSEDDNMKAKGDQFRFIHVKFLKDAFKDLEAIDVGYSNFSVGMSLVPTTGTADFVIDEHTGYVYQAGTDMEFTSTIGFGGTQTLDFHCSAFNQPTVPDHSTLITNLNQIPMSPIYPEP
jgi:hypothetical protein